MSNHKPGRALLAWLIATALALYAWALISKVPVL